MSSFIIDGLLKLNGAQQFQNDLKQTQNQTESAVNKMAKSFNNLAKTVVAAFSVKAIAGFTKTLVSAAAQVNASNAQFAATFKEVGDSATKMFNDVSKATGVMATRLRVAGTKAFSQFKGAGLDANRALSETERYLNLAADAAAYYDISLEDADMRLRSFIRGNVEAGDMIGLFTSETQRNSKALEIYGTKYINLTEAQKQMVMLNIADEIYRQSGALGQASRESGEYANQSGNLAESWLQLKAAMGDKVLEAVIPVMQSISNIMDDLRYKVEDFNAWIDTNKSTITGWVENAKTAFSNFIRFWSTLCDDLRWEFFNFIDAVSPAFNELWNTISPIINTIREGLISAWNKISEVWAESAPFFDELWSIIESGISEVVSSISETISVVWDFLQELYDKIEPYLPTIFETVETLIESAQVFVKEKIDTIVSYLTTMGDTIKGIFSALTLAMQGDFSGAWEAIKGVFASWEGFFNGLFESIKNIFAPIDAFFGEKFGDAWEEIKDVLSPVVGFFTTLWDTVRGTVTALGDAITGDFSGAWENIKGVFSSWGSFFTDLYDSIKTIFTPVGEFFSDIFSTAWNNLKGIFSDWGDFFSGLWDDVKSKFTSIGTTISDAFTNSFKSAFNGVLNWLENKVNWFVEGINKVIGVINAIPGVEISPLERVELPKMAQGGVVDGATQAIVGEAGAEAIVPLEQSKAVELFADRIATEINNQNASSFGTGSYSALSVSGVHDELYSINGDLDEITKKMRDLAGDNENWKTSTDGITSQIELLNQQFDTQKEKLMALNQEYSLAVSESGEMGLNARETRAEIEELVTAMQNTQSAMDAAGTALVNFKEATVENKEETKSWIESWDELNVSVVNFFNKTKDQMSGFQTFMSNMGNAFSSVMDAVDTYITPLFTALQDLENQYLENEIAELEAHYEDLQELNEQKLEDKEESLDEENKALKDHLYSGKISYADYVKAVEQNEKELADYKDQLNAEEATAEEELLRKKDELARKQFEANKVTQIAQVWIQAATATMTAFAQLGPIAGAVAAALVMATAGVQTATISAQQYTPALAEGGIVNEATHALIGEDGAEAIVPLEHNTEWVGGLAKALSPAIVEAERQTSGNSGSVREEIVTFRQMVAEFFDFLRSGNREVVIDGQVVARVISPYVDTELGRSSRLRARGI